MPDWSWWNRIDWRLRTVMTLAVTTLVVSLVLIGAGFWRSWALGFPAATIIGIGITCTLQRRGRNWLGRIDWRIGAILLATAGSAALTLIGFDLGWHQGPAGDFLRDVFAAWIGGVGFFSIVGVIVAIVSIVRPHDERFDARARILFRGPEGKHIDYIVERIREILEHYSEEVVTMIKVDEFDPIERKYFFVIETITRVRSYIDDVTTNYASSVEITDVENPPAGRRPNRLSYLHVGNAKSGSKPFKGDGINEPIKTIIDKGDFCKVAYGVEYWVKAQDEGKTIKPEWIEAQEEANSFTPARYTQALRVIMQNNLPDNNAVVRIQMQRMDSNMPEDIQIYPGHEQVICEMRDLLPNIVAYDFRIFPLT